MELAFGRRRDGNTLTHNSQPHSLSLQETFKFYANKLKERAEKFQTTANE